MRLPARRVSDNERVKKLYYGTHNSNHNVSLGMKTNAKIRNTFCFAVSKSITHRAEKSRLKAYFSCLSSILKCLCTIYHGHSSCHATTSYATAVCCADVATTRAICTHLGGFIESIFRPQHKFS